MSIFKIGRELLLLEAKKLRRPLSCSAALNIAPGSESRTMHVIRSPYEDIKAPCKSLTEFIWKDLDKWSNRTAICSAETGRYYTYSHLRKLCSRFGKALKKQNIRRRQTLSIVLPNIPEYPVILLGSIEAGLTVSTSNPNFTPEELSHQFRDSQSTIIVTLTSLTEKIKSAYKIIEKETKKECPVTIITVGNDAESTSMFEDMINEKHDGCDLNIDINDDDVAILPYSSGTTGFPKGVQLTHRNLVYNLLQLSHENIRTVENTTAGGSTPITEMEKIINLSCGKMKIRHGYGLTETGPALSVTGDGDPLNSIGHPLSNTIIKIIDADGSVRSSYQRGEICVRGPQVMKGYLNNDEATKAVIDADGFFHTGDAGYYNDEGLLFYVDRIKELIKVKGFQVPPVELESIIKAHNGVMDVGVIGVPDERCGEKPVAFVVPAESRHIREDDLKRFVAAKVAPYKQLANVIFVDSIPRNPSGKILRRILREKYASSV